MRVELRRVLALMLRAEEFKVGGGGLEVWEFRGLGFRSLGGVGFRGLGLRVFAFSLRLRPPNDTSLFIPMI